MGPQCEDGYTKIANELLDALCSIRIPGESMQIFLVILRKTYGYGKKSDRIALSQFAELSGIVKTHVSRAIVKLESMNMIVTQKGNAITQKGNCTATTYEINKHYSTWLSLPKKVTLPKKVINVTQKGNPPLPKKVNTKEKTTKERKKEGLLKICSTWKDYIDMRKKIGHPLTEKAMSLAITKLDTLLKAGHDPVEVMEQSIFHSWQSFYEIKKIAQTQIDTAPKESASDRYKQMGLI